MPTIYPKTIEEIIKTLELGLERGDLISIGENHLNVFEASLLVSKLKMGVDKQGLDLHMTYAEMSYLRDIVRKDKLARSRELFKIFVPKDTDVNIVNQRCDEYWGKQKRSPPITQEACIMLLLEKFDQLEDKCRQALMVE